MTAGCAIDNGPDFFVIGAQRAGTTRLCGLLDRHPEIAIPTKEPMFFPHRDTGCDARSSAPLRGHGSAEIRTLHKRCTYRSGNVPSSAGPPVGAAGVRAKKTLQPPHLTRQARVRGGRRSLAPNQSDAPTSSSMARSRSFTPQRTIADPRSSRLATIAAALLHRAARCRWRECAGIRSVDRAVALRRVGSAHLAVAPDGRERCPTAIDNCAGPTLNAADARFVRRRAAARQRWSTRQM